MNAAKRSVVYLLALAGLFIAKPLGPRADTPARPPNIIFIYSDDQRADTIAVLGNKHIRTPNLDALVRRGTFFSRAYCMGANQGAVCVPSRAMMLCGQPFFKIPMDLKGVTTWPELFGRAGYLTFITGKWHNELASLLRAFQMGKAVFLGGMGDPYNLPIADISPERRLTNKRKTRKHSVEVFTDSLIAFLRQPRTRPFLAYIALNGPHDPRVAPKEYQEYYKDHPPPLPPNFLPQHPFNNGDLVGRDERLAPWPRTEEIVRRHLADYYAYITFLDAQLGRIFEVLKELGLDDNTIIVFASDHGLAIGSHGLFGKQNLYDHSMRSPLIMAGPGIPKDKRSGALCYLFDIYPTVGELARVKGPRTSSGKSLVPVLTGKTDRCRESLFLSYRNLQRSVVDERWQLIVYPQINKMQLFNLATDPHEIHDLAADPSSQQEKTRLLALLRQWQEQIGDRQELTTARPAAVEFDFSKVAK